MTTVTFTSSGTWTAPTGVTSVDCQCWGEGGNGAAAIANVHSGGGGGGGEFAEETTLAVTAGSVYTFTIGSGGSSANTVFTGDAVTVTAHFRAYCEAELAVESRVPGAVTPFISTGALAEEESLPQAGAAAVVGQAPVPDLPVITGPTGVLAGTQVAAQRHPEGEAGVRGFSRRFRRWRGKRSRWCRWRWRNRE